MTGEMIINVRLIFSQNSTFSQIFKIIKARLKDIGQIAVKDARREGISIIVCNDAGEVLYTENNTSKTNYESLIKKCAKKQKYKIILDIRYKHLLYKESREELVDKILSVLKDYKTKAAQFPQSSVSCSWVMFDFNSNKDAEGFILPV